MSDLRSWIVAAGFSILVTAGLLYAGTGLTSWRMLSPSASSGPNPADSVLHQKARPTRRSQLKLGDLSLAPLQADAHKEPSSLLTAQSDQISPTDSRDETNRFLASRKAPPPHARPNKLLRNLPLRAYSQDPRGLNDANQAIAPDWYREDWMDRYGTKKQ